MMKFLRLLNFEVKRFLFFSTIIAGATVVLQSIGTYLFARKFYKDIPEKLLQTTDPKALQGHTLFYFEHVSSRLWVILPILAGILLIFVYVFFIWYRDWKGTSPTIYRLMMLPTNRVNIFLTKLLTILIYTLALISVQLLTIPLLLKISQTVVPVQFYANTTLLGSIKSSFLWSFLIPTNFYQFLFSYGFGILCVALVFTGILLERSYRWKGAVLGVIYVLVAIPFSLAPFLYFAISNNFSYLYPGEVVILQTILYICAMVGNTYFAAYLLNKKVNV